MTLEALPSTRASLELSSPVSAVAALFEANPALPGVLTTRDGAFYGVVSRDELHEVLSKPYGASVYLRRPVADFLAHYGAGRPWYLDAGLGVDQAVRLALGRGPRERYGPVAVRGDDGTFSLIDLKELLLAQTQLLEDAAKTVAKQGELARAIAANTDPESLLGTILDGLAELVRYERAVIYTSGPQGVLRAAERGRPSRREGADDDAPARRLPGEGWTTFTLDRGGKVIGYLCVMIEDARPELAWRAVLESYAASAAIAIANARLYSELEELASVDALTGVLNRRALMDEAGRAFERALRSGEPLAAIVMDMDRFKSVNDDFGHKAGDEVLIDAMAFAKKELRAGDIAGRFGGEEFAFILPGAGLMAAVRVAERIRQRLAASIRPSVGRPCTASFGAAELKPSPGDGAAGTPRDLATLMDRADQALYRAKRSGRNRVAVWGDSSAPRTARRRVGEEPSRPPTEGAMGATAAEKLAFALANGGGFEAFAYRCCELIAEGPSPRGVIVFRNLDEVLRPIASVGVARPDEISGGLGIGQGCAGLAALERRALSLTVPGETAADPGLLAFMESRGFKRYAAIPYGNDRGAMGVIELFDGGGAELGEAPRLETIGRLLAAADRTDRAVRKAKAERDLAAATTERSLEAWVRMLELRDQETEGHSRRVTELSLRLANEMGLEEGVVAELRLGALLHDIGKMGIPDSILLKPGPLDEAERSTMAQHPVLAYRILSGIEALAGAAELAYCHHERWDGKGYPRGLRGEEIPLIARIFAVVDVWDALVSDRPYRGAIAPERAVGIIAEGAGAQFDPIVVQRFLSLIRPGLGPEGDQPARLAPELLVRGEGPVGGVEAGELGDG